MKDVGHHPRAIQKKVIRESRKEQMKLNQTPSNNFVSNQQVPYTDKILQKYSAR